MTGGRNDHDLPRELGGYTLMHHLGQGGMGEVFFAHRPPGTPGSPECVVKTVRADLHTDEELLSRFEDEARVAMRMQHPNVARVFDFGRDGDDMYLAMELVDGGSVEDLVGKGLPLPEAAALQILCDILDGLDYAHRAKDPDTGKSLGVVHRDVSPANALVHRDGVVKLIDFGLALSAVKQTKTADGSMVLGKLHYASPESSAGLAVDHRTDQYSAAIIGYELLTGERYYGELEGIELWRTVREGDYRPQKLDQLKPVLRAVLSCALSFEVDKRFGSCGEFRAELARVLEAHHQDRGRHELMAFFGLELGDDDEDPATVGLDAADARAIAAAAEAGAFVPPEPGEATVVAPMLDEEERTRISTLEADEATMAGVTVPSQEDEPVYDSEATVAGEPPPPPPGAASGTGAALAPNAATEAAMPAIDLPLPPVATPPQTPPAAPPSPRAVQPPQPSVPSPFASGPSPAASGPSPAASGPNPVASGPSPVASGPNPVASGPNPVASGPNPVASGPNPVARGAPGRGVATPVAPGGARTYRPPMMIANVDSHEGEPERTGISTGKLIALLVVAGVALVAAGAAIGLLVKSL